MAIGRLQPSAGGRVPWSDSVVLLLLTFTVFQVLGQRALHGLDVPDFINWLQLGKSSHHIHYLFMPLVDGLHRVLREHGFTPHETLLLAAHAGGALGVLALHRAGARLGLARRDATLAALLAGAAPAVVFFATVAEIHGVFFAFAGVACWAWAACSSRPGFGVASLLGAATATAAAVHATGHLLLVLLGCLTWALRGRSMLGLWRIALAVAVVHAVATLGLDALLRGEDVDVRRQGVIGFLWQCLVQVPFGWNILGDVWREWLRPFLPLSVVPVVALLVPATRRLAVAVCVSTLAYLAFTVVLLFGKLEERGAYQLPLAWPAALLLLALVSRPLQVACLVGSAALAVHDVVRHDHPYENPQLVADLRSASERESLFVICADSSEYEPLLRDLPSVPTCPLFWIGQMVGEGYARFTARLDGLVEGQLAAGRAVVVSERAWHLLTTLPESTIARWVSEHLPARYVVEDFAAGSFRGRRLRRR